MQKLQLPDPLRRAARGAAQIVDRLVAAEHKLARRQNLYHRLETGASAGPARWQRTELRPSLQYAGAMRAEAARDPRLARGAVSLLLVLRARGGGTLRTETTKTTLAHVLRTSTRTIGRWLRDLVRFGYVTARPRMSAAGLYTGLILELAEKILPCFRNNAWLANWIAHNEAARSGFSDRTILSERNHSIKELSFKSGFASPRRP